MCKKMFSEVSEAAVLGSIIAYPNECLESIRLSGLKMNDFYVQKNRQTFHILKEMIDHDKDIDLSTLAIEIQHLGLEKVIDISYLTSLVNRVHPSDAREHRISLYVKTIHDYAIRRGIYDLGIKFIADVKDEEKNVLDISADIQEKLTELCTSQSGDTTWQGMDQLLIQYLDVVMNRQSGEEQMLKTGFIDIDNALGGFDSGQLIILAARPGMGKTTLALNIATNACKNGKSVLFVSQEMTKIQIMDRYISSSSGVNAFRLKNNPLDKKELDQVIRSCEESKAYHLDIMEGRKTVSEIKARAQLDMAKFSKLDLIVVDHIQLIKSDSKGRYTSRVHEVGEISHSLKELAVHFKVPVLALSQLSRSPEGRENRRPELSDLRESGDLEQDADVVLGLYRESYYTKEKNTDAELGILKARDAECKNIPLRFFPQFQVFRSACHTR